jgi:predicted amidohydrolase
MEPRALKAAMERCEWIFDFFAIGYDYLASRPCHAESLLERLAHNSSPELRQRITDSDGDLPVLIFSYLGVPFRRWAGMSDSHLESDDFCFKLLSVLWQIDRAAADLNYFKTGASRTAWPRVRIHLQESGLQLNRDHRLVTVRPPHLENKKWWRAAKKAKWSLLQRGQNLDPLFQNLARVAEVPGATFVLTTQLPAIYDRLEPEKETLKIGVAPLIGDMRVGSTSAELLPGPLRVLPLSPKTASLSSSSAAQNLFAVEIDGAGTTAMQELAAQAAAATQAACHQDVDVLVFPELVVPDEVVRAISWVLQTNSRRGTHTPRLTVAGSFGRPNRNGRRYNEAIVLDGNGGELHRQRKMHAYEMHPYEQDKYGLTALFGGVPRQEDFDISPRQLAFFDSRAAGYRTAVLICEDAAQPNPGRQAAAAWRATMVLVPVMAGALEENCWCWKTAEYFAGDAGALTVVANSGGLPRAQYRKDSKSTNPPLAIFAAPISDPQYKNVRNGADGAGTGLILFSIP